MAGNSIFLGGFMAAGKSTIGRLLAKRTGRPFLDTDEMVQERTGLSVSEIFASRGEDAFRALEAEVVREVALLKGVVVALGGGVVVDGSLRSILKERGILVVLDVRPETVLRRAKKKAGSRPLLEDGRLEELWFSRRKAYADAHIIMRTDDRNPGEIVRDLMEDLELPASSGSEEYRLLDKHEGPLVSPVIVGRNILPRWRELIPGGASGRAFAVSDRIVGSLYGDRLGERIAFQLPRGERAKTLDQVAALYGALAEDGIDRTGTVVALGGGTVGDTAGFAAATWMRGISLVQCPTTLLAQVDSSIGGKTGVDLPQGKNLVGAFHRPEVVIADVECLLTLSDDDFRQGLGEVVKYALGEDRRLLDWLEENVHAILRRDAEVLAEMVRWCAGLKLAVVASDGRETAGVRDRLNLGHTVGHALEASSGYDGWQHGDAVAAGLIVAARMSLRMGLCGKELVERLVLICGRLGLPLSPDRPWSEILPFMARDKKFRGGVPRLILPDGEGCRVVGGVSLKDLGAVYEEIRGDEGGTRL